LRPSLGYPVATRRPIASSRTSSSKMIVLEGRPRAFAASLAAESVSWRRKAKVASSTSKNGSRRIEAKALSLPPLKSTATLIAW